MIEFEGLELGTVDDYEQFVTNLAEATGSLAENPPWSEHYTIISFGLVDDRKAIDLLN